MPVLRYFVFVGGALLALLLVTNAVLPAPPLHDDMVASSNEMPVIRIHSNKKSPQPIVFDTNAPMFRQTAVASAAPPAPVATAIPGAAMAKVAAKTHVREAFAQAPRDEKVNDPKLNEMAQATLPAPKIYPVRRARHRAIARSRAPRRLIQVAQQPHFGFGWFDNHTW